MPRTLRKTIFWLKDWIKGSKVRKHYEAIEKINDDHESDHSVREREKYLSEILRHCIDTVPYYRKLGITDTKLDKFPVVDKNLIRAHSNLFRSEAYADKKTFKATTSGSTGTPFTVLHNVDKKRRHTADVHFFWESVGHAWGTKFFYLKIWNAQNSKSQLTKKMQNIVPIDVFKLDDDKIKALLDSVKTDTSPKSILGYASALDRIVKYLERNPTDMSKANVISIIAMSESLDGPTKKTLGAYFNCPVVSRYANLENGMFAQQTSWSGNDFLVNLASYHIEILDLHENIPVKEGEMGRIVVTDLFNRAMPIIRYDTGDLGILGKSEKNGKTHQVFQKIEGRKMDAIYNTKGEVVSSFTITNSMWKYIELAQYQFIQMSRKEYKFKLNAVEKFQREKELIEEFIGYLGEDAKIHVTYVDEVPLLSSGKRKKVLNTMKVTKKGFSPS
ncbi:CoF synthetase [Pricia sp.]|uniref:CoF synthetase n=1 Tax=Pricia sp. TaxID=2268138 RepID=UPI0035934B4A